MAENTLNNSVESSTSAFPRAVLVVLGLIVAIAVAVVAVRQIWALDPYTQDVLSLEGDRSRGQAIFQMNCAVCHGITANGEIGPSLLGVSARKSKADLVHQVVSGSTPPMPQFQPAPQDMADLLKYLETL
ncbi:MAG: cytochrome c [Leptolyngbyaceae cyanobacterium T60_A2020_046]|nr:cytochrome c [Leptolyngbyaceae cyanobacterium T60_A2020_046]